MIPIEKLSMVATGIAFAMLGTVSSVQAANLRLESATLNTMGEGGYGGVDISAEDFLGWRFQLQNPLQVTEIGGFIGRLPSVGNNQIFGAIVALSGSNLLPQGNPFQPGEVLASTNFIPSFPASDITVPLSVILNPGNYALVFGSGLFGASGEGFMPRGNNNLSDSLSYIDWTQNNGFWTFFAPSDATLRYVVEGQSIVPTSVPEPRGSAIAGLAMLALSGILLKKANTSGK